MNKPIAGTLLKQAIPKRDLKTFQDLQPNECQYGFGEDNVLFCGRETVNRVYCAEHLADCYQKKVEK